MFGRGISNNNTLTDILDIFSDYFGEDNVELTEDNSIIVHYPELEISNENNRTEKLYDLFAQTYFTEDGLVIGSFMLKRTTFTKQQFSSGYTHSHVRSGINYCGQWCSPCLGSGPIRSTLSRMNVFYDKDTIALYCYELDKYVHTESLAGGPYIRMADIGGYDYNHKMPYGDFSIDQKPCVKFKNWFLWKLTDKLKEYYKKSGNIVVMDNTLNINVPLEKFGIFATKVFLKELLDSDIISKNIDKFVNVEEMYEYLLLKRMLYPCEVSDGRVYIITGMSQENQITRTSGDMVFKGVRYPVRILNGEGTERTNIQYILNPFFTAVLYNYINNTIILENER